jgi:cytochrome c biogenesis protein
MKKKKNPVWALFSSVKLALFIFFVLATTSIIGTVIPQNSAPEQYVEHYGENLARIFELLNISDMYNSWWFTALLVLFSLNLIICSIERLPNVWRLVVMDNLAIDPARVAKMANKLSLSSNAAVDVTASRVESEMAESGWKTKRRDTDNGVLLFSQQGSWTRLGVYVVHGSILLIFIGAIIGSIYGFKAGINLPERSYTDQVYEFGTSNIIPLDFKLVCDRFELTYYDNGMPKDYRSWLRIMENDEVVLEKVIEVNDPLQYKGITFYQSSYQSYDEYLLTITSQTTGNKRVFRLQPGRQVTWPQENLTFGIVNYTPPDPWGRFQLKIWFSDNKGTPSQFWLTNQAPATVERADNNFVLETKQYFATGLQVAKDPGVWWVYTGCTLMLLGLMVAFFLSHKRIWAYIFEQDGRTQMIIAGSANKNKAGFERNYEKLTDRLLEFEIFAAE